jgi:non-ribosomal peptide synthetase component F
VNRLNFDDPGDRLLGRCLLRQAEAIPDRDFLMSGDERWSYGRVNELANAMARGFQELGVGRGDTVCLLMESSPAYVWTTLGLNKLGAIWVPTSPDYKGQWLRDRLLGVAGGDGRPPMLRGLFADGELPPDLARGVMQPAQIADLMMALIDEGQDGRTQSK